MTVSDADYRSMSEYPETERLASLFDEGPDAILVVDEDSTIRRANDRVRDLFGYEPDELVGSSVGVLVPDDVEDHASLVDAYFEAPESRPMGAGLELQARRKDGSTFPVDISLSPVESESGENAAAIAAVRDVSEQHSLRRKYRTLLDTAPDAAFVVAVDDGEVLEANRAAAALVGEPEADLVGRHYSDVFPERPNARYVDLFSLDPGECVRCSRFENGDDILVVTDDGERVPVEVSAQRVDVAGDGVVLAMLRDVAERREYERELNRQIDRLERVAQVLSHDLRNPLNVAEGNVELARETGDTDRLRAVESAHDRMREIIEEALTMVRTGSDIETVEPVDVGEFAAQCWANVATDSASLDVVAPGIVYADEERFSHLFENLYRNAIEHGGENVTVRVGVTDSGFFVEDDGPGIPPEDRESVFELGWTTEDVGSGLGLNIVADIAAAHDWTPTVTDSDSGGARFEFAGVRTAPYDESFAIDGDGDSERNGGQSGREDTDGSN
jgi:PAS domain S-box-containing protein